MSTVQCKRCRKQVSSSEVRYLSESEYVCEECFLASKGEPREKAASAEKYDASPVERIRLECEKCGFINRFRKDSDLVRTCSYCGSTDLREKRSEAAELLAESEDITDE